MRDNQEKVSIDATGSSTAVHRDYNMLVAVKDRASGSECNVLSCWKKAHTHAYRECALGKDCQALRVRGCGGGCQENSARERVLRSMPTKTRSTACGAKACDVRVAQGKLEPP